MKRAKSKSDAAACGRSLHPVVGPFLFFSPMCVVLAFGEDLNGISGRQMLSLSAFPIIVGYAAYACGFINGHHEGYMKAEDECRPNPTLEPPPRLGGGSAPSGCSNSEVPK